jgi:CheY-like chemotaxis protein
MARKADPACGFVGGIVVKHTFRIGEPASLTEAMKRTARALKRMGSPVADVADATPLLNAADRGTPRTGERRQCQRRAHSGRRHEDGVSSVDETPRILLIEPDRDTRLLYACLFEEAGYAVYAAADSTGAIDVARGRLPDLVVMKLEGAAGDGGIFRRWWEDPLISSIPIVVVASLLNFDAPSHVPGKSIFDTGLALNPRVSAGWEEFLARKQCAAKPIMLDGSGNVGSIQTEFATILPGLHAAAFAG